MGLQAIIKQFIFRHTEYEKKYPFGGHIQKLGERYRPKPEKEVPLEFEEFEDFASKIDLQAKVWGFGGSVKVIIESEVQMVICYEDEILKTIENESIYTCHYMSQIPKIKGLKEIVTFIRTDKKPKVSIK